MFKTIRKKSIYVVTTWSGNRRTQPSYYTEDKTFFLKRHIESLYKLHHNLSQIVVMVPDNPEEPKEFTDYINNLPNNIKNSKLEVIRRPNVGMSYGAFSDAFAKYRTKFKYYFFMKDDYEFKLDNFDKIHIDLMEEDKSCGYLCGIAAFNTSLIWHASMAGGCIRSKALEKLWTANRQTIFPYPNIYLSPIQSLSYNVVQQLGQIGMSLGITQCGYSVKDFKNHYSIGFKLFDNEERVFYDHNEKMMMGPNH